MENQTFQEWLFGFGGRTIKAAQQHKTLKISHASHWV
jgi:hypothetical protein